MVIKSTFVHTGWSYGKGDDQYDNESIGSTETAVKLEKLMENLSCNNQNEIAEIMCSKQHDKQHTTDQGWTTIDKKNKRKPNSKNNKNTNIDSIISSIDIEFNIDKNGTLEATIDSPTRKNRCVVPDKKAYNTTTTHQAHKQEQSLAITPTEDEEEEKEREKEEDTIDKTRITVLNRNKEYEKDSNNTSEDTRSNTARVETRKDKKKGHGRKMETTTASKGEENKEAGELSEIGKSSSEEKQHETNKEADNNNKNENIQKNTEKDKGKGKNNNNKNNQREENDKNKRNEGGNKTRVSIFKPEDMNTYTFTVSWRPENKKGQDGKIIVRMLMREMAHRTPSIVFHPTNSATSPVPRDINSFPAIGSILSHEKGVLF
jgi:hypothetical protein